MCRSLGLGVLGFGSAPPWRDLPAGSWYLGDPLAFRPGRMTRTLPDQPDPDPACAAGVEARTAKIPPGAREMVKIASAKLLVLSLLRPDLQSLPIPKHSSVV